MHRHMGWPDKKQVRRKHFLGLRHRSKRRFKKLSKKKKLHRNIYKAETEALVNWSEEEQPL